MQDAFVNALINSFIGNSCRYKHECIYISSPDYKPLIKLRDNLPVCDELSARIVVVSDTHNRHDKLGPIPTCDIFVHCGDILMTDRYFSKDDGIQKLKKFNNWLGQISSPTKIVIAGNHDKIIETIGVDATNGLITNGSYLENESFSASGLSFFASPLSQSNRNSSNSAFQSKIFHEVTHQMCPKKVDVLITHGHCTTLEEAVDHKVHIWGHHHNSYGIHFEGDILRGHNVKSLSICAPMMTGMFRLHHLLIVLDIPRDSAAINPPNRRQLMELFPDLKESKFFPPRKRLHRSRKAKVQPSPPR